MTESRLEHKLGENVLLLVFTRPNRREGGRWMGVERKASEIKSMGDPAFLLSEKRRSWNPLKPNTPFWVTALNNFLWG